MNIEMGIVQSTKSEEVFIVNEQELEGILSKEVGLKSL